MTSRASIRSDACPQAAYALQQNSRAACVLVCYMTLVAAESGGAISRAAQRCTLSTRYLHYSTPPPPLTTAAESPEHRCTPGRVT